MKVAMVIDSLALGGAERVVEQLATGLARRGHRTFVYCLKSAGPARDRLRAAGVTLREARSFGTDPLLAARLACWLERDGIDVAHAHSSAALVFALPAALCTGTPLVHTRHGRLLGSPSRHRRLAEYLAGRVRCTAIVSEQLRDTLPNRTVARKAVHIPNGIDCPGVDAGVSRRMIEELSGVALRGPIVLSVGTMSAEKDTRGLLAAFARLRREIPAVTLVCAGGSRDTGYERAVRSDAERLGLRGAVHLLGPVPDAYRLMAGADVFCQSSATEAMPIAILEAMSQRVPIVATAVGDVGRCDSDATPCCVLHHDHSALLVPPGEPAALAGALSRALTDRAAAKRRTERAWKTYSTRYTADRMCQLYEDVYLACRKTKARRAPVREARPRVLHVGPAAPQIGGMVNAIDTLMTGPLHRRYAMRRFATTMAPVPAGRSRFASAVRHLDSLGRFCRTLIRERARLVHIHTCSGFTFWRNLLDLAAARCLGRRCILHVRGGQFDRFCAAQSPLGRWLIRRGCVAAEAVVVLSDRWRERLEPYLHPARLVVIPNAVRTDGLVPTGGPGVVSQRALPRRFLFLGRLTEAKGLDVLLAAAGRLRAAKTPFELLIVGPDATTPRADWRRRIEHAGLLDCTSLRAPVTGSAKSDLLNEVDCLVHPSRSEGLPFTVLEAAAAGRAVIATDVGSTADLLPDRPTSPRALVPPGDVGALASAMDRFARDANLCTNWGAALREHVRSRFGLDQQAAALERLYDGVLRRRPPSSEPPRDRATAADHPAGAA